MESVALGHHSWPGRRRLHKTMSDIEASNAEVTGCTTGSIAKPVVHQRPLRLLRRIVTAQAAGLVAGFARQVRHQRTGSGLGVGAALGLRLLAHVRLLTFRVARSGLLMKFSQSTVGRVVWHLGKVLRTTGFSFSAPLIDPLRDSRILPTTLAGVTRYSNSPRQTRLVTRTGSSSMPTQHTNQSSIEQLHRDVAAFAEEMRSPAPNAIRSAVVAVRHRCRPNTGNLCRRHSRPTVLVSCPCADGRGRPVVSYESSRQKKARDGECGLENTKGAGSTVFQWM